MESVWHYIFWYLAGPKIFSLDRCLNKHLLSDIMTDSGFSVFPLVEWLLNWARMASWSRTSVRTHEKSPIIHGGNHCHSLNIPWNVFAGHLHRSGCTRLWALQEVWELVTTHVLSTSQIFLILYSVFCVHLSTSLLLFHRKNTFWDFQHSWAEFVYQFCQGVSLLFRIIFSHILALFPCTFQEALCPEPIHFISSIIPPY